MDALAVRENYHHQTLSMTQALSPRGHTLNSPRNWKTKYFKYPNVIRSISPKVIPMMKHSMETQNKNNYTTSLQTLGLRWKSTTFPFHRKRLRKYKQDIQKGKTIHQPGNCWQRPSLFANYTGIENTTVSLFFYFSCYFPSYPPTIFKKRLSIIV